MSCAQPAPWRDIQDRLRPFIGRRVPAADVDDVMQEVFVKVQRGLPGLREEDRFSAWLYQVARSAVADHLGRSARVPRVLGDDEVSDLPDADDDGVDDRQVADGLVGCVSVFVARLPSPYREALTLVELEGLTQKQAAEMVGISLSGMKSRVQRGRTLLREQFEECCAIVLDARGKPIEAVPRRGC
jgi:RNA polymerase sigma-70 factor (ECF subfamily)